MKLSIIIPAHNEEENIGEVLRKIEETIDVEHELVVVNDHSMDRTAEIVRQLAKEYINIKLVDNRMENGFANAIKTGFLSAGGDVVLPVMGDLCDDLSTIKAMLQKISEGFDVVCGSRYSNGGIRQGGSKLKGFLSAFAGRSLNLLLGIPTHDIANAFKMYKKEVISGMRIDAKGFEISMEIPLKAYFSGYRITEVPTLWRERTKGKSSFKIFKLLPAYLKLYVWGIFLKLTGKRYSKKG